MEQLSFNSNYCCVVVKSGKGKPFGFDGWFNHLLLLDQVLRSPETGQRMPDLSMEWVKLDLLGTPEFDHA